jgi:glycosyltransferase involved in cell wall biosynthesis/peptidoglycan/xylan/chitin deacetylase (PgdA/CDA1 family)
MTAPQSDRGAKQDVGEDAPGRAQLRFSIVIPTYQRRDVVLQSVRALEAQESTIPFEVIVVVDGSRDGTAAALKQIEPPFLLTVLEQQNRGAAVARNSGAALARGEILLFLDDDMEASPGLLEEHERCHRKGADVVLGHIPLHPGSPANFLSSDVGSWAEQRNSRLSAPGAKPGLHDLLTGQLSISKRAYLAVGGFDTRFTVHGSFGNEDVDFGYRLLAAGYSVVFCPSAISYQRYVVTPSQHLRQWQQAGGADVLFARKHPEEATTLFELNGASSRFGRWIARPLSRLPLWSVWTSPLRWVVLLLAGLNLRHRRAVALFYRVRALGYWRGVYEAGGIPTCSTLRILAYHAIADLSGSPLLGSYGVPYEVFKRQMGLLRLFGFRFIHPDELVAFLQGRGGLPRHACLLTFDDCYEDLAEVATLLQRTGVPAIAFAVSGHVGGVNEWDRALGAPVLGLLGAQGLQLLQDKGIEIGAHSRTHRALTTIEEAEIDGEVAGSVSDLAALGIRRPRFFAYPYGEHDARTHAAARTADLVAAFTVEPGVVRQQANPYAIPRIEVLRTDWSLRFMIKVLFAR